MSSPGTLSDAATELTAATNQIANEFIRLQVCADTHGSDRLRSREPFEMARHIVARCAVVLGGDAEWAGDRSTGGNRGARAALEGLPPAEAVDWLRALERVVNDRFLACASVDIADAREGLQRLGRLFDDLCTQEMDSYQSTVDELSGWYSRIGTDLIRCLASGVPVEPHTVNAQARILSVDPHQPFRAIAISHEPAPSPQQWSRVRRRILDGLRRHDPQGQILVRDRTGILLALVPTLGDPSAVIDHLNRLLADEELNRSLFISSGEPAATLAAAGQSCRQALSALEIGIHRGQRGKVTQCTEVILEVLLVHNNWVSRRIVHSRLEPLMEKPHLIDTLRAYIACDMALQRTAEELIVHPNTVAYRLRQIASLTGRDMRSVSDLAELHVALMALDVVEMRKQLENGRSDVRSLLLA